MQFVRMSNICSIFLLFRHQYTCLYMYFCFFGGPFVATMNKPLGEVFSPVLYILYWNRGFAWGDKLKSILYCQYESPLITNLELVRPQKKSRLNSYRQCNGIALLHTNEFNAFCLQCRGKLLLPRKRVQEIGVEISATIRKIGVRVGVMSWQRTPIYVIKPSWAVQAFFTGG